MADKSIELVDSPKRAHAKQTEDEGLLSANQRSSEKASSWTDAIRNSGPVLRIRNSGDAVLVVVKKGLRKVSTGATDSQISSYNSETRATNSHPLLQAILQSDLDFIRKYGEKEPEEDWNFFGMIPNRATAVTPLSMLCRPQLCDVLTEISPEEQQELVRGAIAHGANVWLTMNKDNLYPTPVDGLDKDGKEIKADPNARALTDTVYQGDVDILKIFQETGQVTNDTLQTYKLFGGSLLHMACYDSRLDMVKYLVEECGLNPCEPAGNGTPIFWVFARGPVNPAVAEYLWSRGADPLEMFKVKRNSKTPVTTGFLCCKREVPETMQQLWLSPLSLSMESFPEFAAKVLESLTQEMSNRGLSKTMRFSYKDLLVSSREVVGEDGITVVETFCPKFALKGPPAKTWDTLTYDQNPLMQRSYVELLLHYGHKDILQLPIIQVPNNMMWDLGAKRTLYFQTAAFGFMWLFIVLASGVWPRRPDITENTAEMDKYAADFGAPSHVIALLALCVPCELYMMYIELQELRARPSIRKYFSDLWNWADLFLLAIVVMLLVSVSSITLSSRWDTHLEIDRVINMCFAVANIMLSIKAIQFCSVPKITSSYVSMLGLMFRDLVTFGIIWTLLYVGFTQACWAVVRNNSSGDEGDEWKFPQPFLMHWNWMLGDGVGDVVDEAGERLDFGEEQGLFLILHLVWVIVITIMLFNMLIAMMGNTYSLVAEDQAAEIAANLVDRINNLWLAVSDTTKKDYLKGLWDKDGKNQDMPNDKLTEVEPHYSAYMMDKIKSIDSQLDEWLEKQAEQPGEQMPLAVQLSTTSQNSIASQASQMMSPSLLLPNSPRRRVTMMGQSARGADKIVLRIVRGRNLKKADAVGSSDPYVRVEGWKNDAVTYRSEKSKVIENSVNPQFNFSVDMPTDFDFFRVNVYDKDVGNKDDSLGWWDVQAKAIIKNTKVYGWKPLQFKNGKKKGEIEVEINYEPAMAAKLSLTASPTNTDVDVAVEEVFLGVH